MNNPRIFLLLILLPLVVVIYGCEKTIVSNTSGNGEEDPSDYDLDTNQVVLITLNTVSVTVEPAVAEVSGTTVTITEAGTYKVTGSLSNGQIIVDTEDETAVKLILAGASIRCSNSAPLYVKKAAKVIVTLNEGSENYLYDGASYVLTDGEPNAALFSNSYLAISGTGSLSVTASYKDGISGDDGLVINSGTITVTAADDGIRGKDYLAIRNGVLTINSKDDALKSDNTSDPSLGYIVVDTGEVNITTTAGDGLNASGAVTINEGTFFIASGDDAMHSDGQLTINGGTIKVTKCYEGLEGPSIAVNGGKLDLTSSDDTFNATAGSATESNDGSSLTITGGTIVANASKGDCLDSNGNITMTGGTLVAHGPASAPEVGADYNGTFQVSGGLLVFTGPSSGNMIQTISASSSQRCIKTTFSQSLSSSSLFHIVDQYGNYILTYKPVRSVYYIVVCSPGFTAGTTYSLYTGGTTTGAYSYGLYTGGTYSGGTLRKSVTLSGIITNVSL